MATTVTAKGQVTIPKNVRDAAGLKPGDRVEVRAQAGGAYIEKVGAKDDYKARLYALGKKHLIRDGKTTDEIMTELRGDPAEDPALETK
jgi:AbrB family looped-hinge helix DNA binding protein